MSGISPGPSTRLFIFCLSAAAILTGMNGVFEMLCYASVNVATMLNPISLPLSNAYLALATAAWAMLVYALIKTRIDHTVESTRQIALGNSKWPLNAILTILVALSISGAMVYLPAAKDYQEWRILFSETPGSPFYYLDQTWIQMVRARALRLLSDAVVLGCLAVICFRALSSHGSTRRPSDKSGFSPDEPSRSRLAMALRFREVLLPQPLSQWLRGSLILICLLKFYSVLAVILCLARRWSDQLEWLPVLIDGQFDARVEFAQDLAVGLVALTLLVWLNFFRHRGQRRNAPADCATQEEGETSPITP